MRAAVFKSCSLTQSNFEDSYFRKAEFVNVDFTGSTFKFCNFEKATFKSCSLRYCSFYHCKLPLNEIIACLPQEPNLRRDLARNLRSNCLSMGDKKSADIYLNIETKAAEELSKSIFLSKTRYFKDNYNLLDRIHEFLNYISSKISGLIWGYGYRFDRLIVSFVLIALCFSLLTYLSEINFIVGHEAVPRSLTVVESVLSGFGGTIRISSISFTPISVYGKLLLLSEGFLGTLFLALLAATLYRKIAR